jgi:UDP-3-O-[3-hydroxymyristoyl] N-acetylglucosamine deacetylase/3-hydroxyacyl-[acyl-carrier-protein] dehydratase
MLKQQQTIARPVSFSGIGIHTGSKVTMTWKPAPVDHGIKFVRTDLESRPIIEPLIKNIGDTTRWTTITNGTAVLHTVEHVLATLTGFGIDNVLIELDGNEPPVGDGSSLPFTELARKAGTQPQEGKRDVFQPKEIVHVQVGESLAVVLPSDQLRISCTISYGKAGLDSQFLSLAITPETFETQLAPARTFAFFEELHYLIDKGLIKGGSLENAVLIRNETVLATEPLRFRDEFVRHKMLDIVGDVTLLGRPLAAHIVVVRPGHGLNAELTKALAKLAEKQQPAAAPVASPAPFPMPAAQGEVQMDIMRLMSILPHRYPFLMVDRILKIEGDKIIGLKNVTINEPFFQGHFPGHPIMPGVLQIEAMAQVAGILMLQQGGDPATKVAYFMSANNVKWRKPVRPGDQLIIEIQLGKMRGKIGRAQGTCKVGEEVVSEAEVMFTVVDK